MSADPRPSPLVVVLVVLVAIGTCALFVGVFAPTLLGGLGAWPAVVGGAVVVLAAFVALWVIQKRRDRTLW